MRCMGKNGGAMKADFFEKRRKKNAADRTKAIPQTYDRERYRPVLKCSICNGEQVAGFKEIHTGKFEEVMLIRNQKDLDAFRKQYGIDEITKEY